MINFPRPNEWVFLSLLESWVSGAFSDTGVPWRNFEIDVFAIDDAGLPRDRTSGAARKLGKIGLLKIGCHIPFQNQSTSGHSQRALQKAFASARAATSRRKAQIWPVILFFVV